VNPDASAAGPVQSWLRFWFTPIDPIGLHAVRLLAGILILGWLLPFAGNQEAFFGLGGWFDAQAYREAARLPEGMPAPLGWSILYPCGTSATLVSVVYWLSVAVLVLFTLGLWTRVTAVLTWAIVASFIANPVTSYGPDHLLGVVAFYLMIGYLLLGQWSQAPALSTRLLGSRDSWLFGPWLPGRRADTRTERPRSYSANLAVRLLQVHFAIVVLVSGLHKLQFGDWWAGVAFWYPLHPPFETTPESVRAHVSDATSYLFMLSLAQYSLLAWQIGFPLFAWRKRWRPVLLGGALVGWVGAVLLYKQPLIGPVFVLGCLSYLTPAEWHWVTEQLARVVRLLRPAGHAPVLPGRPVKMGARS
jgi:hypothetical protein